MPWEWEEWALNAPAGIEPREVRQVLDGKVRWPRPGGDQAGVRVLTIWGRTAAHRPLIVAVYRADEWTWKIIGAREMRDGELREFARWEETR